MTGTEPTRGFGLDQLPLFERGPRAGWLAGGGALLVGGLLLGLAFNVGGAALLAVLPAVPLVALGLYGVAVASSHVIVSRDRLTVRNLLHQVDVAVTGVRSITWGPLPWSGPLAGLLDAVGLRRDGATATLVDGREVALLATVARAAPEPTSSHGRGATDRIVAAWRFARSLHG